MAPPTTGINALTPGVESQTKSECHSCVNTERLSWWITASVRTPTRLSSLTLNNTGIYSSLLLPLDYSFNPLFMLRAESLLGLDKVICLVI